MQTTKHKILYGMKYCQWLIRVYSYHTKIIPKGPLQLCTAYIF